MTATTETISVRLVKDIMNEIESRVIPGEYELRASVKEIVNSVRVTRFRSYMGKTWTYAYKMFGKEKQILANDVVLRKVSVFGKDYETVEYKDGRMMILPQRTKFDSWRHFLSYALDRNAVRHQVIPIGITRNGIVSGKPQMEN